MLPLCLFWVVLAMGLGTATIVFVPKNIRSGCRILGLEGCLENSAVSLQGVLRAAISLKYWRNGILSSFKEPVWLWAWEWAVNNGGRRK